MTIDELYEEFEDLGDWDDQCDFLIDLGFELPQLADEDKTDETYVHGCQSNVWLIAQTNDENPPAVSIVANSDAIIVNGLIAVLLILYSGKTAEQILAIDAREVFARLGLDRHVSPIRRNGLFGMVERIREFASTVA